MVTEISTEELHECIGAGDPPQIIDIRPPSAFQQGHIPGAQNLPMAQLATNIDQVEWADKIVVACPIGQSSVQAARLIGSFEGVEDSGTVYSLAGGYNDWEWDLEQGE
ncbi:rhodanese-like domain-containing protein [Halolamina sp.]|jgi:rhodanese-related sulfurtransferase|uniref:rhodanese-like domain-containing protein n=1 Tax=Halolamina sp. TaxID=1940283 RepID=UPI00356806EC